MEKTAAEIQKERIADIEKKADALIKRCPTAVLSSINENGYPRSCAMGIAANNGFREIYFITSKRSELAGKVTHFERSPKASVCFFSGGDSVTLVGDVEIVLDRETQESVWSEEHRAFFKKGIDDPKFRLLKFTPCEATFWIEHKFRTCKYSAKK